MLLPGESHGAFQEWNSGIAVPGGHSVHRTRPDLVQSKKNPKTCRMWILSTKPLSPQPEVGQQFTPTVSEQTEATAPWRGCCCWWFFTPQLPPGSPWKLRKPTGWTKRVSGRLTGMWKMEVALWIVFVQEQCCAIQGDQQQPQKRDSQWCMFPVTTTQLFVVACGSYREWAYNIVFLSEIS